VFKPQLVSTGACCQSSSNTEQQQNCIIKLLSIAIWIVVLLGLVEKVNINQTSDFR
jgi:hypothetical protein